MANQRKIIIINPSFQVKVSLIVCTLICLGSLIYPFAIYDLFEYFIVKYPDTAASFKTAREDLLIYLIGTQVGFTVLVFVFLLFITHKIAGPMYKLKIYMQGIRNTGEIYPLKFRKGDYFSELPEEINQTLSFLVNKSEEEVNYLSEISSYLENLAVVVPEDKKAILEEMQTKISKIQNIHSKN